MKLLIDTANLEEIRRAVEYGIVDGVTTNPSMLSKEGLPIHEQIRLICNEVDGDVSAPVLATELAGMIQDGRDLAMIHRKVVVELPITPDGIRATCALRHEGIRVNCTLCFSPTQALVAARAGAFSVSVLVGRLDENGESGVETVQRIVQMYQRANLPTQVMAASIRSDAHVVDVALAGADYCTLPLKKIEALIHHPLTGRGLETFLEDYRKVFPSKPVGT